MGRVSGQPQSVALAQLLENKSATEHILLVSSLHVANQRPGLPLGLILLSSAGTGMLRIEGLAIAATERNLGYGAEAVYELENRYPGVRLLAGVPLTNGLAIYFWLRVGYRPLFPETFPLMPDGSRFFDESERIWMERGGLP